jgi:hypothetical protein
VLVPEARHGIKEWRRLDRKNCPDLENQESIAERKKTFYKKLVDIYKHFGSSSPCIFEN